ncbi:MAG: DUF2267 domain-containing protein [Deltaproteobacteria bacterium]|nr:DUF2267 domain-containing protein [Deltaproteobacteria bacterium]
MGFTGLGVFDSTIQKANIWLKDIGQLLHWEDRHHAYVALRAVLHALRDHLTLEETVQLADQLPMLIRGLYFEGWRPSHHFSRLRKREDFLRNVRAHLNFLHEKPEVEIEDIVHVIFWVLSKHVSFGEIEGVRQVLPKEIRGLWRPFPPGSAHQFLPLTGMP